MIFICYGYVLSKKMEFEKEIKEEIRILNYIKNAKPFKKVSFSSFKGKNIEYNGYANL